MKTLQKLFGLAVLSTSVILTACSDDDDDTYKKGQPDPDPTPAMDIVETAQSDDRFETLVQAVITADLVTTLKGDGPFTVFAPTDDAFAAYLEANGLTAAELLASPQLADILTYHVISGEVPAADATALAGGSDNIVTMVNGDRLALSLVDSTLYTNGSSVIVPDVFASNGVIHAIDRVLIPPMDKPDAASIACGEPGALGTLAELATEDGNFSTLLTAVGAADEAILTALTSPGALTLFAPNDAAFAKVDETALNNLLADQAALTTVLSQHVYAAGAVDAITAYSLNGKTVDALAKTLTISVDAGELNVEGVKVIAPDAKYACNGIIHVIDNVIL